MKIEFEANEKQIYAAAEVLKRIGYTEIRALSASEDEAYNAQYALEQIRAGLAAAGYIVR